MASLEDDDDAGRRLWAFAISYYGQPGVSDACLILQDEGGADIPALLFCLWVGLELGVPVADKVADIVAEVQRWQREVVGPLRTLRRGLKGWSTLPGQTRAGAFRDRVKAVELEAEKVEMMALAALATGWPAQRPERSRLETASTNLDSCRDFLQMPATGRCGAALDVLKASLKSANSDTESGSFTHSPDLKQTP